MKKLLVILLALMMVFGFCGCQTNDEGGNDTTTNHLEGKEDLSICLFFTGTFGGYSNHDNIYNYLSGEFLEAHPNYSFDKYECAGDTAIYQSALLELCESGKYDIIILGNYALVEYVYEAVEKFPDQHFLFYDAAVDYENYELPNVTSIQLAQNQLAFKVGVLAALMTESTEAERSNPEKVVAYVGPGVNTATVDFLYGYIDGVNYVDSEINIVYSFIGDWSDTGKAKDLTLNAAQQGADFVYAVCGGAGLGVMEGAYEKNMYAVGCDYDVQAALELSNQPSASAVLTSSMKDFPHIIGDSLDAMVDGSYDAWGVHTWVDSSYSKGDYLLLIETTNLENMLPASVKEKYDAIIADLRAGKIEVSTAIGASEDDWNNKYAEAAPFTK